MNRPDPMAHVHAVASQALGNNHAYPVVQTNPGGKPFCGLLPRRVGFIVYF